MRLRPLALTACALLSACSGSKDKPDAGPVDAGDPAHLLGLLAGNCFEYTDTEAALPQAALGAAVESDSALTVQGLPDGGSASVQALKLVYRVGGVDKMEDFLLVDGKSLLLLKRNVVGAETTTYAPAMVIARVPFKNADHLDQTGSIREYTPSGSGGTPQDYSLTFDVTSAPLAVPDGDANGATGYTFSLVEQPTHQRLQSWTFKEGLGPAEVSGAMAGTLPDGGVNAVSYKLQATRTLGSGQVCGIQ